MADTKALLAGLIEYRTSLRQHLINLRTEFEHLDNRWRSFDSVYSGDAADQFRAYWERTTERFREYVQRTESIVIILDERIEYLTKYDQTESLLS